MYTFQKNENLDGKNTYVIAGERFHEGSLIQPLVPAGRSTMKQHNSIYAVEEDGQDEQERQSNVPSNIKDLPVFLRKLVTHSAKVTYRRSMMLLYFLAQIHTFFVWYQITQSSVVGGL